LHDIVQDFIFVSAIDYMWVDVVLENLSNVVKVLFM